MKHLPRDGKTGMYSTAMYSSASSRVRVGTALSPAFAVQRGVAQGCPLSPLLYAIFIDPVLQDMQSLSHPGMLWVGPAASKRKLVGQAYADDLAGTAAAQQASELASKLFTLHLHYSRAHRGLWMRFTPIACAGVGCSTCPSRW